MMLWISIYLIDINTSTTIIIIYYYLNYASGFLVQYAHKTCQENAPAGVPAGWSKAS